MKRKAGKLLNKAINSLILSVELFNRPNNQGRMCAVLISLDHAMEMLLKAAIVERGGSIQDKSCPGQTIGFDRCVGRALSDGSIQFLDENQAKVLRAINAQRDAAQHYLLDMSEELLYILVQSGVTVFRDILSAVFHKNLCDYFPERVFPVSTRPSLEIYPLFEEEIAEVKKLLTPNTRRKLDAEARLRSLLILDTALTQEEVSQPSRRQLNAVTRGLRNGEGWETLLPGVAATGLGSDGEGHQISLYFTKKEGIPVTIVDSSDDSAAVMIRNIGDFDRYSLTFTRLGDHLGLNRYELQALVWYARIKGDDKCYKEFKHGAVTLKRYSKAALDTLRKIIQEKPIQEIKREYNRNYRGCE